MVVSFVAAGALRATAATCPTGPALTAGTQHCSSSTSGTVGSFGWSIWSSGSGGCITPYGNTSAFKATWTNSGDFLAREGFQWDETKTYDSYGTIGADYAYTRTGTAGGYSYIGVYGWATSPCTEYYIIDDSFGGMPFNAYGMQGKGSATIDGEVYKFFSGSTNGTGGSRCNGGGGFTQYWSVRQKGRQCGVMTITKHFEEWKKVGMNMDNILEAKILVETGGGQGTVEFPIANVKASK